MAFFGLARLGYQNPLGDKMIAEPGGAARSPDGGINIRAGPIPSPQGCPDTCSVHQPPTCSTDIHHGSQQRYKEMVKRLQTPRSPNQLYTTPVTDNQQYGWVINHDPWTQVKRFPRRESHMTKFVKEMLTVDPDFSLF